jgi:hypothetical protein
MPASQPGSDSAHSLVHLDCVQDGVQVWSAAGRCFMPTRPPTPSSSCRPTPGVEGCGQLFGHCLDAAGHPFKSASLSICDLARGAQEGDNEPWVLRIPLADGGERWLRIRAFPPAAGAGWRTDRNREHLLRREPVRPSGAGAAGTGPVRCPDPPAQPGAVRRPPATSPGHRQATGRDAGGVHAGPWTASSPSTTPWATRPGTGCFRRSPFAWATPCGPTTRPPAWGGGRIRPAHRRTAQFGGVRAGAQPAPPGSGPARADQ